MGEINTTVTIENTADRAVCEAGFLEETKVRRTTTDLIVDTGAVSLVLPQNVVERLGLKIRRTVIVTYADERTEERPVAGPVTIHVADRFMTTDCVVGRPLSEGLLGQVLLESLDLLADCANQTLVPRTPDYPCLKLKYSQRALRRSEGNGESPP